MIKVYVSASAIVICWLLMICIVAYRLFCRSAYLKCVVDYFTRDRLYDIGKSLLLSACFFIWSPVLAVPIILIGVAIMLYNLPPYNQSK